MKEEARRVPPQEPANKRFRRGEVITFSEADVVPAIMLHCDALVIKVLVTNREAWRVYVDNGPTVSIIYLKCFH